MSHRKSSLSLLAVVGVVGLLAEAPHARAADLDLDPGYAGIPVASAAEQKVEFGSGWYVRGDMGVEQGYSFSTNQPPNSVVTEFGFQRNHALGYDFTLGGGYAFTNSLRSDITADIHQPSSASGPSFCYDSTAYTCELAGSFRNYDALINGYYDFGPWGIVSPYVGAGVGVAFGELKNTLTGGSGGAYGANIGYHNLAFALMAGITLDVYAHTKLDIGYRYLNSGRFDGVNLYNHELRAGLRYMIDN